jgi:hypothetical protein
MTNKSSIFFMILSATLSLTTARASLYSVSVTLDNPVQDALPGDTLQYFGTIQDTGTDTVFLNSDDLNIIAPNGDFVIDDLFLANAPISLDPGQKSADIELFDVTVSLPFPDTFNKTYAGVYDLIGGVDGNAMSVLTNPDISFGVMVTPEPGTCLLVLSSLIACGVWRKTRLKQAV